MRKHVRWVRKKRAILKERVGQVCCREGQTISQGWLHIFYRADTLYEIDVELLLSFIQAVPPIWTFTTK